MMMQKGNSSSKQSGLRKALGDAFEDTARGRGNFQKSLAQSTDPGASRVSGGDHSELVMQTDHQSESRISTDESCARLAQCAGEELVCPRGHSPADQAVCPMRQVEAPTKMVPKSQRMTTYLTAMMTKRLPSCGRRGCCSTHEQAVKPMLVIKSSILLNFKLLNFILYNFKYGETKVAHLEIYVRAAGQVDLGWGHGCSKPVPVAAVDDKLGTDLLEEEITESEEQVQSVDIATFGKSCVPMP
ncbi:LOW QUALITY PROTEIN: Elongation factor 1-delta, partial [Galemys pyrenaicus]